ncbi:hypothetical protein AK812_SmicGene42904 [Symbiodinium microadriaticum]|uniref:Uncharacterized protein n=1 Tax=Symbiodinium microadriaticum TaxID=2951 RepID=A0A1Q9C2D7_SYMMI|nr:hypothetical protein AK812_SmicGene42904 [Symbiodinium microadriaticum]CAE7587526.1 unnamed protein product [Symbiodinium microadriaticum]CAE7863075.1 unnamed protein product [Symbiodinium sp. KB8]
MALTQLEAGTMSPTCRRACWLAGRRHPQHAQSGGKARGLRVSPSVFFAGMATCRAERRLQYDLECQCFYLLRAEERASAAVAVLRALLQLPLLRGGQRGLIAGLVASFLTPVLVEPTALPVVEPIRFPTFQDARGLLPPFVVLPSVLVDLWAEVRIVRCLNSGLRARAMEHWRRVASLENREGGLLWELGCLGGS